MKFAQTKKATPVPIEERSREELLNLLEQTRRNLERAEILLTPLCCWDGSEGLEEEKIIECLGLLVVAYEVGFWCDQTENKTDKEKGIRKEERVRGRYYELFEMVRKLLLTAVFVIFFGAWSHGLLSVHNAAQSYSAVEQEATALSFLFVHSWSPFLRFCCTVCFDRMSRRG